MLPQYKLPYIKSFPQNPWMYCTWFYDHNYLIDIWMVCRSVFCFLVICHQNVTPKRALQIAHWFIIIFLIFFVKLPKTPPPTTCHGHINCLDYPSLPANGAPFFMPFPSPFSLCLQHTMRQSNHWFWLSITPSIKPLIANPIIH